VADAFDMGKADFTGMGFSKGTAAISQIKHKAVIEVNEQGAEAAAATAVEIMTKSAAIRPKVREFTVDRPFFFILCDQSTNTILFMGRVMDPRG
jgi:serpin B